MQVVDVPIETIHLYVVREQQRKPSVLLPLLAAVLCLAIIIGITVYSAFHPTYETLTLPAHFLPLKTFKATEPVIPTGIKTYPATTAHGILMITNGSVIAQELPKGLIFTGNDSVEVVTDSAVFVPSGSASGYGIAYVSAHPIISGREGNIAALDINSVEGSSVYIRNLRPFTGGQDAYSVKFVTLQDKQTALDSARVYLAAQAARIRAILAIPCSESATGNTILLVAWICRFVAYPNLPGYHITGMRIEGRKLLVDVSFIPHPRPFTGK